MRCSARRYTLLQPDLVQRKRSDLDERLAARAVAANRWRASWAVKGPGTAREVSWPPSIQHGGKQTSRANLRQAVEMCGQPREWLVVDAILDDAVSRGSFRSAAG